MSQNINTIGQLIEALESHFKSFTVLNQTKHYKIETFLSMLQFLTQRQKFMIVIEYPPNTSSLLTRYSWVDIQNLMVIYWNDTYWYIFKGKTTADQLFRMMDDLKEDFDECPICCETINIGINCGQCYNKICNVCLDKLPAPLC